MFKHRLFCVLGCKSMKKNTNQSIFFEKNILLCLKNIKMLGRNIIIKL